MREHSVLELRRKLTPHAESADQLEAVLAELGAAGYLSDERFAHSLARRRGERYGRLRIEHELDEHRVPAPVRAEVLRDLAQTERQRALAAWAKRFGRAPADPAERARQYRFLAQRGFDGEVIAWVMRRAGAGACEDE